MLDRDQLLLPFAEREYVDVKRAAKILGISERTVLDFCTPVEGIKPRLEAISYAAHKRKRIRYQSIVDFCEALRTRYGIADRRPLLASSLFRHRDADLLPFPLEDTIDVKAVMEILGYASLTPIYMMIEEGRFEAYQLANLHPWRISRISLAAFIARAHGQPVPAGDSRPSVST